VDIKKTIITRQPDGEEEEVDELYAKTFIGEVGPPLLSYQIQFGAFLLIWLLCQCVTNDEPVLYAEHLLHSYWLSLHGE